VIAEVAPTTIDRGYAPSLTLSADVSTTTVVAIYYSGCGLPRSRPRPTPKVDRSSASLRPEYQEPIETGSSDAIASRGVMGAESSFPGPRSKNAAAIALINRWLADDSGHDERTWPLLKKAIERSRTSKRKRFRD